MVFNLKYITEFMKLARLAIDIKNNGIEGFIKKTCNCSRETENFDAFTEEILILYKLFNNRIVDFILSLSCLKRSLVVFFIANKYGVNISFKMGIKNLLPGVSDYKFSGHAWVEIDNEPFMETLPVKKYTTIYSVSNSENDYNNSNMKKENY
jgi:hypothetical protein